MISCIPLLAHAESQGDTITKTLREVVVSTREATTLVSTRSDGTTVWNTTMFDDLPKILGNADPVHYAQMLPGVQTNSELDAGLHIQGSENTHNLYNIQGVPLYNVAHLLGLFSVFNASHYSNMILQKSALYGRDASRLGGTLEMELPQQPADSLSGELSVGLISSQGTLRLPTSRHSSLVVSGRGSYLNLLYSRWLTQDDASMHYSFYDLNATWQWQPNERHHLWVDVYHGRDKSHITADEYQAGMNLKWGNTMAALHWDYEGRGDAKYHNTLYYSRLDNRFLLSQSTYLFRLPSNIADLGARSEIQWHHWNMGGEAVWHNILPQNPQTEGLYVTPQGQDRYHTQEYSLWANYQWQWGQHWLIDAGVRGSAYVDYSSRGHFAADPSWRIQYTRGPFQLQLAYAFRHQYIYQTGATSLGLPTEFWTSIGQGLHPQWGHGVTATGSLYVWDNNLKMTLEAYYKRLYNQVEYDGDMMKFLNADYRLEDNLLHGRGYNYGLSVMVQKTRGAFTGWISYSYGRARRRFVEDGYSRLYSANHERPHEINALASWHVGRHWVLSGVYIFASGTPFTAPSHFYMLNAMLLNDYGEHNAHRLRHYSRLDLSVNYLFHCPRLRESGINLSVYNVLMHKNDISCRLKVHNGNYLYSHFYLLSFMLPSVSYYIKF